MEPSVVVLTKQDAYDLVRALIAEGQQALPDHVSVSAAETRPPVRLPSRTGKPAPNMDARTTVRNYLRTHPEASALSVRQLASAAGVSKTVAHETLTEWKAAHSEDK